MKKRILIIMISILCLTVWTGCGSRQSEPAISSEEVEEQSVEVSYAETAEDFIPDDMNTDSALSSSERAKISDMLLYLAVADGAAAEEKTQSEPSYESMMGFAWAVIYDNKYDTISADKEPDIYLKSSLNEKIFAGVFEKELPSAQMSGEIFGWQTNNQTEFSFISNPQGSEKQLSLGDIAIRSIEEEGDDTFSVSAVAANSFIMKAENPLLEIKAQLKKSGSSPFGYAIINAEFKSTSGINIGVSSAEASSHLTTNDGLALMPENLFDGDVKTVWAEAANASGTKEYIKFYPEYADASAAISAIGIVNGNLSDYFDHTAADDQSAEDIISRYFSANGRARRVRLTLSNGFSRSYEIPNYDTPTLRPFIILLDSPVKAQWAKISIEAASWESDSSDGSGVQTYLSEIYLYR